MRPSLLERSSEQLAASCSCKVSSMTVDCQNPAGRGLPFLQLAEYLPGVRKTARYMPLKSLLALTDT